MSTAKKVDGISLSVGQRPKKYFSRFSKPAIELPNLFEGQTKSFEWLVKDGIKAVFQEYGSIKD